MNNYNNVETNKLKYVIYCRKSSEGEDKQVQSLDTQMRELKEHAERNELDVVDIISESKSAFKVGRDGFETMMNLIKKGRANAILVIRANRISRNPIDAGHTISLMDEKKLMYIRTPNSTCYTCSSSDKMMIAFELIFSKKDSDDKSDMVKEGQKTKALKGVPHGLSALGFLNDKTGEVGNKKWIIDKDRFEAIKTLFKMFLTGTYSAGKLHKFAVNELKLTTVKHKKTGGALIALSRIYEILKDPIYAGFFYYGGEKYEFDPKLPRIISAEEHEKVKMILAKNNIPKFKYHKTTYAGFLMSDKGKFIGQDVKYQLICDCKHKFAYLEKTHCPNCGKEIAQLENPKYLSFTYYYNVSKKKARQKYKSLSEANITKEILNFVDENLTFSLELAEWSKKHIVGLRDKEVNDSVFKERKKESDIVEYETKKTRLRQMLRDEQITPDEYKTDLITLNKQYIINDNGEQRAVDWFSRMNEIVDLTLCTKEIFEKGDMQAKRNVLSRLGSNLIWDDEKLFIYSDPAINKLVEGIKGIKAKYPEFEPKIYAVNKGLYRKIDMFSPIFSMMLRGQDSNLRPTS